jgi:hypothetical protein
MLRSVTAVLLLAALVLLPAPHAARAVDGDSPAVAKRRPVVVGNLAIHPADIVAVYRPVEQQSVVVYVGRTGHAIQPILFGEARDATAVFEGLWNNKEITKDPGEDDAARPLTRMMPKDANDERNTACLILNVDRVMACRYDPSDRAVRIYIDKLTSEPLLSPGPQDREYLEIRNSRDEADKIMAAYKACLYTR